MTAASDEHIIICGVCRRKLIVKDNVNNGVAFLSHLKNDHGISYTAQRMTESKVNRARESHTAYSDLQEYTDETN
jgi:uncharacterized CHY-type Zn-finger protein